MTFDLVTLCGNGEDAKCHLFIVVFKQDTYLMFKIGTMVPARQMAESSGKK